VIGVGILFAAWAASPAIAQAKDDSYQWSAELVALDEVGRTVTFKTMAVGDAIQQATSLKPADKVLLTWSGFDKYASAINGVRRYEGTVKPDSRFAFPAEFVSFTANTYLTFKAQVPPDAMTRLKGIKLGQWVTATSQHGAHASSEPITAIRGYNDLDTAKS
jgi:hypothetical protein